MSQRNALIYRYSLKIKYAVDFWHAIQHRREPDAGNAKYWFRQVARHPIAVAMTGEPGYGSPAVFVDVCERVRGRGGDEELRARELQFAEWRRLMAWCVRAAD